MRRFHTLPKIPYIPDAKHRRQQTGDLETNFDPCKITQLCQNGGTCVSKKGANSLWLCYLNYISLATTVSAFQLIMEKPANFWRTKQVARKICVKTMRRATGNSHTAGKPN
ncbi:unnamed protein product [Brugia timori]|uniref:Uncharacterized protein n=1 Tax=Brugia timori TaxID=42155 RepID=A0A0R3QMV1_9BILA|nr:unnamed protein product [Brugia timori]